jgi:hypothetical protein
MHVTCPGCGETFRRNGLLHHIRQSDDPLCRLPYGHKQSNSDPEIQDMTDDAPGPAVEVHENGPQNQSHHHVPLGIDPLGDIFGDYSNYIDMDFGIDDTEEQDPDGPGADEETPEVFFETQDDSEDSDEDLALFEAILAEEEQRLEPEQPSQASQSPRTMDHWQEPEHNDNVPLPSHHPYRLRGGFEEPLGNQPEIIEFSVGKAGATYARAHHNGNRGYY